MIFGDVQLYNAHELVQGRMKDLLREDTIARLKEVLPRLNDSLDSDVSDGYCISRIPDGLRRTLNPLANYNGLATAGVELRFNRLASEASVTLCSSSGPQIVLVYQGCFVMAWYPVGVKPMTIPILPPESDQMALMQRITGERDLPFDPDLTRIILPREVARLVEIEGDLALPRPGQTPSQTCLFYGSSITHGAHALRPTGSYAMRTAERLGVDCLNLGSGGGAHLEPQMADYMAERDDWDFASLEMGINILDIDNDDFAQRVEYFVTRLAQAHPDKWIFCIDVFTSRNDLDNKEKVNAFREIVRHQVESLNMPRLVYISGRDLLTSWDGLTCDLVHPAPAGMEQMADKLAATMRHHMGW